MSAPGQEAAVPLLFNWEAPPRRGFVIAGFIGGSVMLHALCFYMFQVVYPASVALSPPPGRVMLIAPTTEEGRTLLRWIEAEDPALASATMRPPEGRLRALPKVQHVPSYVSEEPKLKSVPPLLLETRAPSSQPPGPAPLERGRTGTSPVAVAPTFVRFSEELAGLGEINLPAAHFTASSNESPQSFRLRIAVNSRGEIRHCFSINSSGDPALDEQARQQLVLGRFQATAGATGNDDGLRWGIATFAWGNDIVHPAPAAGREPAKTTPTP